MFRDVTREKAKSVTRTGQVATIALVSLAGVVFAIGLPGMGAPKIEKPVSNEAVRPPEPAPTLEMPQIIEKRAGAISRNLAQLGNAPKPPPPEPLPGELGGEETPATAPAPPVPDTAIVFLGVLGSSAHPMALVSIDTHQQVLAEGDTVRKSTGEAIKLVKVERESIEVDIKGVSKKIDLAPRSGNAYTVLSGAAPASPGIVPGMTPPASPGNPVRTRQVNTTDMRGPGSRPRPPQGGQRFDESSGAPPGGTRE